MAPLQLSAASMSIRSGSLVKSRVIVSRDILTSLFSPGRIGQLLACPTLTRAARALQAVPVNRKPRRKR